MRITFLTLFPEMFSAFQETSIIGRAVQKGIVSLDCVQIRDFAKDKHRHVDDTPFGGGAGMVMKCQPVLDALESVRTPSSKVYILGAGGAVFRQKTAHCLSAEEHLILICGHYEGMDARIEKHVDGILSVGDYVLTGGELPAMVIADAVIRLLDGSIRKDSAENESFEQGLLEYPQYTQPADYNGEKVPDVLLSGHHENIRKWRLQQSLVKTKSQRPDLFAAYTLNQQEEKLLKAYDEENED